MTRNRWDAKMYDLEFKLSLSYNRRLCRHAFVVKMVHLFAAFLVSSDRTSLRGVAHPVHNKKH